MSLSLVGGDDYVEFSAVNDDVAGDFSFSGWVQAPSGSSSRTLLGVNDSTGADVFRLLFPPTNELAVYDDGANDLDAVTPEPVADGNFHHVAYVVQGTHGSLFVDDQLRATHQVDYALSTSDEWSLGQDLDNGTPSNYLNGIIDEIHIYSDYLTPNQVVGLRIHPTNTGKQGRDRQPRQHTRLVADDWDRDRLDSECSDGRNPHRCKCRRHRPNIGHDTVGRGVVTHVMVRVHGAQKTSHEALGIAPRAGDSQLTLAETPTGWEVGDTLVLAGTYHDPDG
ncbi:MAG: LamG domain-containing protein [Gemmataceae bacterium]